MKFGFFKGRSPLLCAPLCNDYRQVSRILALNRTGGLKRKWNWKTWVLCQNDEMMPKQLVYKAGVRTWGVGRCQMSWSQPFRKMAGASGSAPRRPSICAPLCLDARTHAVQVCNISAVQKIKKLSETPVTVHNIAKLCVIDGKNREITKKLVQPVPPVILGVLGGTKNGTWGAWIKILRPPFNTNTPPKTLI